MFIKKDKYGVGTGRLRKLRVLSAIIVGCCVLFINTAGVAANGSVNAESEKKPEPIAEGEVSAALLAEVGTGRVVYEYNSEEKLPAAGLTRLAALVSVCKGFDEGRLKPGDAVSVSEYAASMGGSQVFLEPGETQTVDTMIKCISVASANDAAVAMAEYVAGSEQAFVDQMNHKAKELGMKHTHFMNCNGLDDSIESGHYSSAYDVALMSRALISGYPQISHYSTIWMDEITHSTKKGDTQFGLTNTNKLIRTYQGITGLKTGSTSKAKYCLSATASRAAVSLTAVVMAAPDPKIRFSQAASLLDYGFANCTGFEDQTTALKLPAIPVKNGVSETVIPYISKDFSYTLCKGESGDQIERRIEYKKDLTAPIRKGDMIGRIVYTMNNQTLEEIPVYAARNVSKATYTDCLGKLLKRWFVA